MINKRTCKAVRTMAGAIILSVSLAMTTVPACAASPEFAHSEEEWAKLRDNVMEYWEIEDLIHEYNTTVQNNEHDYNDKKSDPSADDIAEEYRDAAEELRDLITGEDSALLTDAMYAAQANQLEQLADNNVMDLKVYRLAYDQTEKTLAMAAQTQLASYHQMLMNLETLQKNRALLQKVSEVTEAQYAVGMASRLEVISAKKSVLTADASIHELETAIKNLKQNLCVMLGWKYDAEPEIMEIPAPDMDRIAGMNPAEDVKTALENNYTLRMNLQKLENAEGLYTKQSLENTIQDNEQKIGTALETDYRAVLQAKIALEDAKSQLETQQTRLNVASEMYRVGSASELAYMQQETATFAQNQAVKLAEIQLFMAMETYDWDVRGMASAQ